MKGMLKAVFIKEPEPKELVRKWQADLRKETRNMERQIRGRLGLAWSDHCTPLHV